MGSKNAGSSDLTQEKREKKSAEAAKSKALQILSHSSWPLRGVVEPYTLKCMTIANLLHLCVPAPVSCAGWLLTEHIVVGRTQALG